MPPTGHDSIIGLPDFEIDGFLWALNDGDDYNNY